MAGVRSSTTALAAEADIVRARRDAKDLAASAGFGLLEQVQIATAVSELARNVIQYAGHGEIVVSQIRDGSRAGLEIVCRDRGPGIASLDRALAGGYSTSHGLGRGLAGARSLLDEFRVETAPGRGTTVWGRKWLA